MPSLVEYALIYGAIFIFLGETGLILIELRVIRKAMDEIIAYKRGGS